MLERFLIIPFSKYLAIVLISLIFGVLRWAFLDREFPLIGLSDLQIKSMKIKKLSDDLVDSTVELSLMKEIVDGTLFPIIDARDFESYDEGHISNAINIDAYLLIEDGDEEEANKLSDFLDNLSDNKIIIYCWNPDCDRAEFLKAFLIDSGFEFDIFIYEGGWDEWSLTYK